MKKYKHLAIEERYTFCQLKENGYSNKKIAKITGRHKSTVGRELLRNSVNGKYSYKIAKEKYQQRRVRCVRCKKMTMSITSIINSKLSVEKFSPMQISAHLKSRGYNVSHELIYQYIRKDRILGGRLYKNLLFKGKKFNSKQFGCRSKIKDRVSISERPKLVDKKIRIGDWEGDTIVGKDHKSYILTLVDRVSKYLLIRKLPSAKSEVVADELIKCFGLNKVLFKTLTLDNGLEFASHKKVSDELGVSIYFANPSSPWQRGLNENTNRTIRQFFPKGTDFRDIDNAELLKVQHYINRRPRETMGFKTPYQVLYKEIKKLGVALAT